MANQIILQTTFTERVSFAEKPDAATRRALLAAGFRFNGSFWAKTHGTTGAINPKQLADILAPMIPDERDMDAAS